MKKKLSPTLQFFVIGFLIAVFINAIVSTAQIFYTKDFEFVQVVKTFVFVFIRGVLFFCSIYFVLYLLALLFHRLNRGRLFWILMIVGILSTVVTYMLFRKIFLPFTNETRTITAIAAFSVMVSLASQYQQFIHPEGLDKSLLTEG